MAETRNMKKRFSQNNYANAQYKYHEFTFSCFRNQPFLNNDAYCNVFAESLNENLLKYQVDIIAYVIMPTHVHIIVHAKSGGSNAVEYIKAAKQSSSRKILSILKRAGNEIELEQHKTGWKNFEHLFWQRGGGYNRVILKEKTIKSMISYIHNNPVRKGLVSRDIDWKWSSARDWMLGEKGPVVVNRSIPLW